MFQAIFAFFLSAFAELIVGADIATAPHREETPDAELVEVHANDKDDKDGYLASRDPARAILRLRREALQSILLVCSDIQTTIGE